MNHILIGVIALAIFLAGCGSQRHEGQLKTPLYGVNLNDYKVIQLPYRGRIIYCIQFELRRSANNAVGGLSCDYNRFYNE